MEIKENIAWVYYIGENANTLDKHKCGKWMYFFDDKKFVSKICKEAVARNIVVISKHSNAETGVACFYLNGDDLAGHKKVIGFFFEKNLKKLTKAGRFYNIPFKYDDQTRAMEYGFDFKAKLKLEDFINLETGEWIR